MDTIVVGTDGSESSMGAVRQAAELGGKLGATLHIVCAVKLAKDVAVNMMAPMPTPVGYDEQIVAGAQAAIDQASEIARTFGVKVEGHVVEDDPAHGLITLCDTVSADLLVVGSRGMTGAARFLLGSVPNRCAHHAKCSVLIVRTV